MKTLMSHKSKEEFCIKCDFSKEASGDCKVQTYVKSYR